MNDEFVTKALQKDRYLKAIQLIDRFETELRHGLEYIGNQFVETNRDLFVDQVESKWNNSRSSSSILAFARVDYQMDRLATADDDAQRLKLNISFRWVEPGEWGHMDVNGALSVLSYKLKRATVEDHQRVIEQTRDDDWPVQFANDAFNNSPGIFYIPAASARELRETGEILRDHFTAYATEYGVDSDDIV